MKLYDFAFSPNCRKVRAVAYEIGVPLEHVPIDLLKGEQRGPDFLARNPNGRVPLLEDGDLRLWESNAIILYLATTRGGAPPLVPAGPRERAEVDRWLSWQSAHLSPAMTKVAFERIVKKLTAQGLALQSGRGVRPRLLRPPAGERVARARARAREHEARASRRRDGPTMTADE